MLHRAHLPIVSPCARFVAADDDPRWCLRCDRAVHDLSRLDEAEVRALFADHPDGVCVEYRARADGSIVLRPSPRVAVPLAAGLLLACAAHTPEPTPPTYEEPPQLEQARAVVPQAPADVDADADAAEPVAQDEAEPVPASPATGITIDADFLRRLESPQRGFVAAIGTVDGSQNPPRRHQDPRNPGK